MDLPRPHAARARDSSRRGFSHPWHPISLWPGRDYRAGSRPGRRVGRIAVAGDSGGRVGSRRSLRDARPHGRESRHRRAGRHNSHLWRHLRHRLEGEPPQLPPAAAPPGRTAEAQLAGLELSACADDGPGNANTSARPIISWRDWSFLLVLMMGLALVFALPVILVVWFVAWLISR